MSDLSNVIAAFSAEHVMRLTSLSKSQLRYWDKTGFSQPRYAFENRRSPFSRIYSFKDVVGLRTLGILRNDHGIPLQYLRKVARELKQYVESPWSDTTLYVRDKEVVFNDPHVKRPRTVLKDQYEADIPLKKVAHDVVSETNAMRTRSDSEIGQIRKHRYIQHNAAVISGTRIPTKAICRYRQAGYSIAKIMGEYPSLTRKDIKAAMEYESQLAESA